MERLQRRLSPFLPGHGITQGTAQAGQDRGLQEEAPNRCGFPLQDLFDEVVDDVSVVPREAGDESGDVVSPLHRQAGELQRRDPALRPALQGRHIGGRQAQAHHPVEVGISLIGREAQVTRSDLDQFAPGSHPGQRERRIGAAGDHQPHVGRQVIQHEGHAGLDVRRSDDVVVVEDEDEVAGLRVELVEQGRQHGFGRQVGRLEDRQGARPDVRPDRSQGRYDARPEGDRMVVAGIERKPGRDRAIGRSGEPLGQERRLAEAGRSRDEGQLGLRPTEQALGQAWPWHQAASGLRRVELRREQLTCHATSL